MQAILTPVVLALALPGAALAATKTFDTRPFEGVSAAAGVVVDVAIGPTQSVVAETNGKDFTDLRIEVDGSVLRIDRPNRSWLWFSWGQRTAYRIHVVTPTLHSLTASSGSEVTARGSLEGNFTVEASSGSEVDVSQLRAGAVTAHSSSGSDLTISGSCLSLDAHASSGSDLDAEGLQCERVTVHASSGSDISVGATKSVTGSASSGSDVKVRGTPSVVQVDKSSGADVVVRN